MPKDQTGTDGDPDARARRLAGRVLRDTVPRRAHAAWVSPAGRADPVEFLVNAVRHDISHLTPIRFERMRASPANFLRGSAGQMAADLAHTPTIGIAVQSCGDCHLHNFGVYATPEGTPVFDINDFDETLPAPLEWDLKRLATSFVLEASARRMPVRAGRGLARAAIRAYRERMDALVDLAPLDLWRRREDLNHAVDTIEDPKQREREARRVASMSADAAQGYPHLIEKRRGSWRIVAKPPLVQPLNGGTDNTHEMLARSAFDTYRRSLSEERQLLLARYNLREVAFKIVGIGSVGTFCAIGLFVSADDAPLLLQIKEARRSVLAPWTRPSLYENHGRRVVTGQRIMQAAADLFLGWTDEDGDDQHCYVRQLKDPRLSRIGDQLAETALEHHAILCGQTLARAHARSGDPAAIAGYMGRGGSFDNAIAAFAGAYAAQVTADWKLFRAAIKAGQVAAAED